MKRTLLIFGSAVLNCAKQKLSTSAIFSVTHNVRNCNDLTIYLSINLPPVKEKTASCYGTEPYSSERAQVQIAK